MFCVAVFSESYYYPPCPVCQDSECYPGVCSFAYGNCDHSCVGCKEDRHCEWTVSKPYCSFDEYECVECLDDIHCTSSKPFCNLTGSCVECLRDSDCTGQKAYCSSFQKCELCLIDIHCRNNTFCNAKCKSSTYTTLQPGVKGGSISPSTSMIDTTDAECYIQSETSTTSTDTSTKSRLTCEQATTCYPREGQCYASCNSDNECPPKFGNVTLTKCHITDGKCYECVRNEDCNNDKRCESRCDYDITTKNYYCSAGISCPSTHECVLNAHVLNTLKEKQFTCQKSQSAIIVVSLLHYVFCIYLFL